MHPELFVSHSSNSSFICFSTSIRCDSFTYPSCCTDRLENIHFARSLLWIYRNTFVFSLTQSSRFRDLSEVTDRSVVLPFPAVDIATLLLLLLLLVP